MTQEEYKKQYNEEVNEAMTELMLDNQIKLYQAVKEERYEDAAKLRDTMIYLIDESLKVFTKITSMSKEELKIYFTQLANDMLDEIEKNDKKNKKDKKK
jgi:hypothetical protein